MTTLRLSHWRLPRITVIIVDGELDATNHGQLQDYITQVRQQPADQVVFDLSAVPFLDNCGLRVLLNTHLAARHGGGVHIAAATAVPLRILEISGVAGRVPTYDTVEQALQAALTAGAAEST